MNINLLKAATLIMAYSFFIVCPRMAAMTTILSRSSGYSLYLLVVFGTLFSIPLLVSMCWIILKWGLMAGLGFAVLTDLFSALILAPVSIKSAIETFIIALFVVAGNRFSVWITSKFLG